MKKKLFSLCLIGIMAFSLCACTSEAVTTDNSTEVASGDAVSESESIVVGSENVTGIDQIDFWVVENTEDGLRYSMSVGEQKAIIEVTLATDHDAQWYYDNDILIYQNNEQPYLEGETIFGQYTYKCVRTVTSNAKYYTDSNDGVTIIVEMNDLVDTSREDVHTILESIDTK